MVDLGQKDDFFDLLFFDDDVLVIFVSVNFYWVVMGFGNDVYQQGRKIN